MNDKFPIRPAAILLAIFLLTRQHAGFAEPDQPVAPAAAEHALGEAEFHELLTAKLQRDYVKDKGELELLLARPWPTIKTPAAPILVNILDVPSAGVTPSFIVRFELRTTDRSLGTWQLPVAAHVWREVWVAHTNLKRGEPVSEADLVRERRDVVNTRENIADFSPGDAGLELAEPVPSGAMIYSRTVKLRTVIRRGQMADGLVQSGALSISTKVEALEDGAPGQIIRARNPVSRREMSGKVLNEQTIQIPL